MRLFHFSEETDIEVFEPRLMAARPEITAPLVWAIEEARQAMYLFPRDCPRILYWPLPSTTPEDLDRYWGGREGVSAVACIEWDWLGRMHSTAVTRYHLPPETFEDLQDAGMWVSREAVRPSLAEPVGDLVEALRRLEGVELRLMRRLTPLRGLWETSLHASGIRLRNAQDWQAGPSEVPSRLRKVMGVPAPETPGR